MSDVHDNIVAIFEICSPGAGAMAPHVCPCDQCAMVKALVPAILRALCTGWGWDS